MANMSVELQMEHILDEFNKEVQDAMDQSLEKISKESVQKLRGSSPKKTGKYSRGWTSRNDGEHAVIVHNRVYQLTHLLENGHVIRNKKGTYGRVGGIKHIKPVEEWANNELPLEIMRRLGP